MTKLKGWSIKTRAPRFRRLFRFWDEFWFDMMENNALKPQQKTTQIESINLKMYIQVNVFSSEAPLLVCHEEHTASLIGLSKTFEITSQPKSIRWTAANEPISKNAFVILKQMCSLIKLNISICNGTTNWSDQIATEAAKMLEFYFQWKNYQGFLFAKNQIQLKLKMAMSDHNIFALVFII